MDNEELAEMVYNHWVRADKETQKSLLRYTLRHCGMSVLLDVLCYFNGIS